MSRVGDQLADNHQSLQDVSRQLLQVQSRVDQTEQSLFGKVVDANTIRTLYGKHQMIDGSNIKAQDDITKLDNQVSTLSTDLGGAQRKLAVDGRNQRSEVNALTDKITQDKELIQNLTSELTEYQKRDLPGNHQRLCQMHDKLLEANSATNAIVQQVTNDLNNAKKAHTDEVQRSHGLKQYLVEVHHYGVACHSRVQELEKDLRVTQAVEPRETAGLTAAMRQSEATAAATEQRLLAEGALLRANIRRLETQAQSDLRGFKTVRREYETLQASILAEVQGLEAKIAAEKGRIQSLTASLHENMEVQAEDAGQRAMLEKELGELQQQVSPVQYATLQGENDALQAELDQTTAMLAHSKASEAKAVTDAQQARAAASAQKATAAIAEQGMQEAREEGLRQLAAAVAKAAESKATAERTLASAESAIASRCQAEWDERSAEKNREMQRCDSLKEELLVAKAQEETLRQTLSAQQASD